MTDVRRATETDVGVTQSRLTRCRRLLAASAAAPPHTHTDLLTPQQSFAAVAQRLLVGLEMVDKAVPREQYAVAADGQITVSVADRGPGFDPQDKTGGLGLAGLRERIESIGGRFTVDSRKGAGTRITVHLTQEAQP